MCNPPSRRSRANRLHRLSLRQTAGLRPHAVGNRAEQPRRLSRNLFAQACGCDDRQPRRNRLRRASCTPAVGVDVASAEPIQQPAPGAPCLPGLRVEPGATERPVHRNVGACHPSGEKQPVDALHLEAEPALSLHHFPNPRSRRRSRWSLGLPPMLKPVYCAGSSRRNIFSVHHLESAVHERPQRHSPGAKLPDGARFGHAS